MENAGAAQFAERLNTAFGLYRRGDLPAAERLYRQILQESPDQPDTLGLLGELLIDRGRTAEAITLMRRFTQLQPANFAAHYGLGNAYRLGGQIEPAILAYQAAIALNPGFAGAHHGLGAAFRAAERERDAAASFRKAVQAKPDWALAWQDVGMMLAILGEFAEAEIALERALALQPGLGEARRHLAAISRAPATSEETASLRTRAGDPRTPEPEKIETLFTLGRLVDKAAQFDAAFDYFAQANALLRAAQARAGIGYDRARMTRDVDQLISIFTTEVFAARRDWGDPTDAPVFIVGMPRAGSTLFEQIAASHTAVFGAGECKGIGAIANKLGWKPSPLWSRQSIQTAAATYLHDLQAKAGPAKGDARRIIDKMPDNIFQLGLIATLFPNARIIFCQRDPLDTCISCFFQHFSEPYGFDTDLADCAHRYLELDRLARHWRDVLPLRTMTLFYEALTTNLEGEARRLIGFLGLAWEASCLNFHQTTRPVRTASWAQVREPLYDRSVGRWRHYEAHLAPLRQALRQI